KERPFFHAFCLNPTALSLGGLLNQVMNFHYLVEQVVSSPTNILLIPFRGRTAEPPQEKHLAGSRLARFSAGVSLIPSHYAPFSFSNMFENDSAFFTFCFSFAP
ncbi:hypothetical protein, partial [Halalkalibacterium halodurans]|uniref:hypothetical protein n=1 Tax=Halalkalibacterium halodurans TaxID=86665 RepID=UPI001ABB4001